jgi:hypothetical protein
MAAEDWKRRSVTGLRSHEVSMSHEAVIGDQSYLELEVLEVLSNFTNQPLKGGACRSGAQWTSGNT